MKHEEPNKNDHIDYGLQRTQPRRMKILILMEEKHTSL